MTNDYRIMKEGDVFFTSICNLRTCGFFQEGGDRFSDLFGKIYNINPSKPTFASKDVIQLYDEKNYLNSFICIKYLGKGVFEELLTHEKILGEELVYFLPFNEDQPKIKEVMKVYDDKECIRSVVPVFLDDYLEHEEDKTDYLKYNNEINILKDSVDKYPLSLSFDYPSYFINDESKKQYLQLSDEKRKELIVEAKKKAIENAKLFDEGIEKAISMVSSDTLDMAYLENDINNFENKKR